MRSWVPDRLIQSVYAPLLFCLAAVAGCTSEQTQEAQEQETSGVRMLAPALGGFVASHQGRYPQSEEELRKFLQAQGKNPDEVLKSQRDGQTVVIVTEADRAKVKGKIVAYEREGKDGKRLVIDDLGVTQLLTEEEFRKVVPEG